MDILKLDVLLRKEPFKVALPSRSDDGRGGGTKKKPRRSTLIYKYLSQDDFLSQWDTSGHYIHNRPDWKDSIPSDEDATSSDDESANVGAQKKKKKSASTPYVLQRRAFPLQRMIHKKRVSHLCTNPLKFQIKKSASNQQNRDKLTTYKEYWTDSLMETAKFELISEAGKVGDAAIYIYKDKDEIKYRSFSYSKGDTLYEHKNRRGERIAFAREYTTTYISADGEEHTDTLVDVWTKDEFYTLDSNGDIATDIDENGNIIQLHQFHNLGFIPIVYLRLELPFWGAVQDLIDDFEFLMSMIGEYNTRQAFQMLLIKTNGRINIQRNGLGGTSILRVGAEDDAQFMGKMDASNSLFTEIDNIYNGILDGSGVVPPMQSSSGDRPTGTTAMYYEPEMEWARSDAQMMNTAINDMANIFKYYVGVMEGDATGYNALRINATIEPYSYIDFSEWNNTLVQLVNSRIISLQTAREESDFSANNEDDRMDEQDRRLNDMEARVIEENNENNENNDNNDNS